MAFLELDQLLAALLDRITEILSVDTAAILLLDDEEGTLVARAAKGLEEEVERGFNLPVGQGFAGRVAALKQPVVIGDLKPGDAVNPLLYEKRVRSLLGVPLIVEGRLVGVLHVGSLTQRDFSEHDAELLRIAADRAALGIEHARLYEGERHAREKAERALERLEHVQTVTEAALAYLGLDDLLRVLLERVSAILDADTAAILLADDEGKLLTARAAKGLEEEVERGFRLPVGEGFAGRVAAERRPVVINGLKPGDAVNPLLYEKAIHSLVGVPLIVERKLIGVLHCGTVRPRDFTDDDVDLLQLVADRAALAIEHDRLYERFRAAEVLQRMLLPTELVAPAGLALSARYLPAGSAAAVGGDWYDVVALPAGRVGVMIGDVVGHGLEAATLMGSLRNAFRAYALEGLRPAELADRVARFAESYGPHQMATYMYGVIDVEKNKLSLVNGSHPQPVLVRPDGTAEFVIAPVLPPLGVAGPALSEEVEIDLDPGCTVLLYTDGLVERRGTRLASQQELLLATAAEAPFDPSLLCDAVLEKMLGGAAPADDVALLAFQRTVAGSEPLKLRIATRAEELAAIRRLLRTWLADAGAHRATISAVLLASGEACSNAMEHAYGPSDATFDFAAEHDDRDVTVTIRDNGRWRPPRGQNRGRGLRLMETFMDEVEVTPADDGTTVRLRRRLASA